jgi:predicted regulator of Ras-like GTPase activity (Roadblock/LC7/MglB family)
MATGADGLPVIAYFDATNDDLRVAHCGNPSCTSGNALTPVDSAGDVGHHTSMAIGADGLPVIAYFDNTNDDLKVAHCGNPSCTSGIVLTPVDSAGEVGLHSSMAVGADGVPVIAYYDFTNYDLKVAHCGNSSCTSGNALTPVDSAGDVGLHTSMAVGADGLPVIAYFDLTNDDLKVAHCGNSSCTSGNVLAPLDSAGYVGIDTSIAMGADGVPVISYYDLTTDDLKVARPTVP